jgi:1-aminocyclopropane-1-carboxylate deaminase/D-cysteine desulfhydrase-like pyridoxal-dependent ACC family enzyme
MPASAANMIAPGGISATTKNVSVGAVSSDKPGYVVAHEPTAGTTAGTVLGYAPVQAGLNRNITIPLDIGASAGRKLIIMLHEETDGDGKFDTNDLAVAEGGQLVQQIITVK